MPGRQRPRPMKFAIRNVNPCISLPKWLVADVVANARAGDRVLVMSNGGFGGVHQRLLDALQRGAQSSC